MFGEAHFESLKCTLDETAGSHWCWIVIDISEDKLLRRESIAIRYTSVLRHMQPGTLKMLGLSTCVGGVCGLLCVDTTGDYT